MKFVYFSCILPISITEKRLNPVISGLALERHALLPRSIQSQEAAAMKQSAPGSQGSALGCFTGFHPHRIVPFFLFEIFAYQTNNMVILGQLFVFGFLLITR